MWYNIAADLVIVVHLLFIGFVVGGVFLAWRWPWVIWAHLPAVAYGALVEFIGFTCPLTLLQNFLRHRGGEAGYRGGFIAHYLVRLIYPPGLTRGMQIGLGIGVLLIAVAGYRGFLRSGIRPEQADTARPTARLSPAGWPLESGHLPGRRPRRAVRRQEARRASSAAGG